MLTPLTDFAELNAPPMINYGVVYPQAILIFVITLLYSVMQPLIVIFGAVYFGMAYMVYKYKLLFGVSYLYHCCQKPYTLLFSILQTLRIARASLANHLHPSYLGCRHIPSIHDWNLYVTKILYPVIVTGAIVGRNCHLVVVCCQESAPIEQVRKPQLRLRGPERRGDGRCSKITGRPPGDLVAEVSFVLK